MLNNTEKMHISVVIPVYECTESLSQLYERLIVAISSLTRRFEIILVNDGSPDLAWESIAAIASLDSRVKGINLSRNFGQHHAITAGLDIAQGEWVVVMDCDLQDQPEEICKLYQKAQDGFDIVFGCRTQRKDGLLKRYGSKLFYTLLGYFTDCPMDSSVANFSIISNKVVFEFRRLREKNRDYALLLTWMGFKQAKIEICHAKRPIGESSYTLYKLIRQAAETIITHSSKPLRLSILFGFLISCISLITALILIFRYYYWGVPVAGWTSVMVSMYFIGGLIFANMGVLGLYIGKIFNENKDRPIYIVEDTLNVE